MHSNQGKRGPSVVGQQEGVPVHSNQGRGGPARGRSAAQAAALRTEHTPGQPARPQSLQRRPRIVVARRRPRGTRLPCPASASSAIQPSPTSVGSSSSSRACASWPLMTITTMIARSTHSLQASTLRHSGWLGAVCWSAAWPRRVQRRCLLEQRQKRCGSRRCCFRCRRPPCTTCVTPASASTHHELHPSLRPLQRSAPALQQPAHPTPFELLPAPLRLQGSPSSSWLLRVVEF